MSTSVPAAKAGIRNYLRSWEGLRPSDGVTVRGAPSAPGDLAPEQVTLGDTSAPQSRAGLVRKAENPTVTGWIRIIKPGNDDAAEDAARARAYQILDLVQAAITRDPTAQGSIPGPGGTTVGGSDLEEYPADLDGTAGRGAQLRFTITWESHLI